MDYAYGIHGELIDVRVQGELLCKISYEPDRGKVVVQRGTATTELLTHNEQGRVIRSELLDADGWRVWQSTVDYDNCERLVATSESWGESGHQRSSRQIVCDREGRVLGELDGHTGARVREYDYDAKGNLIYDCGIYIDIGTMDEPLRRGDHRIDYDPNGNITTIPSSSGRISCSYTAGGLLKETRLPCGKVVEYQYDALGRRIAKTDGQRTWRFGWSGYQLVREELLEDGEVRWSREYIYLPDDSTPFVFRENGCTYWIHTDARGAAARVFDDTGELVWAAVYDSFGVPEVHIAKIRQPWRLVGQYEDEETGLHYNLARYYCPWLRTYLSLDPHWMRYGATNYSYAANDPWNRIDPLGTFPLVAVLIGAAAGAIIGGAIAWYCHGSWRDILAAAIGGAIGGAIFAYGAAMLAAAGTVGLPLYVGLAKWGFLSGFSGSLTSEVLDSREGICWECVGISSIASAVLAPLLYGAGQWISRTRVGQWLSGKLRIGGGARTPNGNILKNPKSIWGKSADEIADELRKAGYKVKVEQSTRGSKLSQQIRVEGHPEITNIEVHPGGGRHGGSYYKISTSTQGKIKVVDPKTYIPDPKDKSKIIHYP
ncbi:RHS repeat-associated core domain-containing protein [Polyangium spumosum]|uniref:RHS repeat domain-containing protein n=1 Tax=Polyangium spumosum TaxID=889282 RepID=UPI00308429FA